MDIVYVYSAIYILLSSLKRRQELKFEEKSYRRLKEAEFFEKNARFGGSIGLHH